MSSTLRGVAPRRARGPALAEPALRAAQRIGTGGAISGGVALAIAALALGAQGGAALTANTTAQVLLIVAAVGLVGAALCAPSGVVVAGRVHGAATAGAVGALTLWTVLSIIWSLDPATSWVEANRSLSYLAVLACGLALVRLAPRRWDAVLRGIAAGATTVSAWALLTKSFPGLLAPDELFARLRAPFGYWNATGLMAALGIPPLVWLGARRSGHGAAGALAYPALGICMSALMLSYSRGSLLALGIGLLFWFSAVPLRLRSLPVLLVPALTTAAVVAWVFGQPGLTENAASDLARADAGLELGLLLTLQAVLLLAAGLVLAFLASRTTLAPQRRELLGRGALGVLAALLVTGLVALATAPGGIDGQVTKAFKSVTSADAPTPGNTPSRLTATSSVRARYWKEAFDVHAISPWVGTGAGAYGTVRKRFRSGPYDVAHAHGYVPQVLADLGWVGLLVSLVALVTWFAAAIPAVGLRRRDRGLPWDAERVGVACLFTVALVFGVHSTVDWTWFIPATAAIGLLCAGWIAGRGPLRERLAAEGPTGMVGAAERVGMVPAAPRLTLQERAARWNPLPSRVAVAAVVVVAGAATCWAVVQPLRASNASDVSLALLDAGRPTNAADTARIAAKRNPLAVEPWWDLAEVAAAQGDAAGERTALEKAVRVQPANVDAWTRLGEWYLDRNELEGAIRPFQIAYFLDPQAALARANLTRTTRALANQRALAAQQGKP